ncbi:MAG: Coenzyme F420 hydrogenase/dehydrogenase, beta subunit C-terminal domain [Anaerolineae bacterium]|nr:MAG: Coenzyme F420 hydrogenase/dehydrogenase, beta subunit C-terminal domain [Anaerolineae bacterium]
MSTRLQQEVWALYRCSGCGACVAACSKGVLYWDGEQHPLLEERQKALGLSHYKLDTCSICEKFCELSCPRLVDWAPMEPRSMVSARSAGVVHSGAPNDVIQALLVAARSAELIDGVVMLDMDPFTLEPVARVVTTVDQIVSSVGMQYLWAPVLSALNEAIFEMGLTKLAVVGPPCVAEGARRFMNTEHTRLWPYQQAIRLTIASFCTGIYMPEMVTALLERGKGIARQGIRGLTTSVTDDTFTVAPWDGAEHIIPLTEVEPFTRKGCGSCDDYLGESADIAVGAVGALPGFSTLITRTPAGEIFVQNARRFGLLETLGQVDAAALSAAKEEKDRRERAQAFDEFRILMLDALSDPAKRAQVRKQMVNLYGAAQAPSKREEYHVSCSGC